MTRDVLHVAYLGRCWHVNTPSTCSLGIYQSRNSKVNHRSFPRPSAASNATAADAVGQPFGSHQCSEAACALEATRTFRKGTSTSLCLVVRQQLTAVVEGLPLHHIFASSRPVLTGDHGGTDLPRAVTTSRIRTKVFKHSVGMGTDLVRSEKPHTCKPWCR